MQPVENKKGSMTGSRLQFVSFIFSVPSNPTTFTATPITENSVTLNWKSPDPYPGPTNYTLVITDRGSRYYNSDHTDSPKSTLIPGSFELNYASHYLQKLSTAS